MKRLLKKPSFRLAFLNAWLRNNSVTTSILIVALLARLYRITYPIFGMHAFRQTQTASTILNYYRSGIDLLRPTVDSIGPPGVLVLEFPLFQALSAVVYKIASPDIIHIRVLSIIFCLVAAIYLYKLVIFLLDRESAIFSMLFFLFAPLNIFFSRTPMIEAMAAMLSIMFLYCFVLWIEQRKGYVLILGVILASLALIVKPPYSLIMFPVITYYACHKYGFKKAVRDREFLVSLLIPMVVLICWQAYANYANSAFNSIDDYPYKHLHHAFQVRLSELNTWYFGTISQRLDPSTYIVVAKRVFHEILTVVGAILLVVAVPFRNRRHGLLFEVWLAAVLLSFVALLNLNYVHNYYQLPGVSILSIYCGRGLKMVWDKIKSINITKDHQYKVLILILLLYLFNVAYVVDRWNYYGAHHMNQYRFGEQINSALSDNNDMVAISTIREDIWDPTILYFADRKGYMVPHILLDEDMISYFRNKGVVWLVILNYSEFLQNYSADYLVNYPVSVGTNIAIFKISE